MSAYTANVRRALDELAAELERRSDGLAPDDAGAVLTLAMHLRDTPAEQLDDPHEIAAELAEAYAAALDAAIGAPASRSARRAISGAVRATPR